jgi:lysyl-tRNA synthetase class 2
MAENEEKLTDQELARRNKLPKYDEMGVYPYGHRFERNTNTQEIKDKYSAKTAEELMTIADKQIIAGRIILLRKMGKASFFNIQDRYGSIQCYIKQDNVGEANYNIFRLSDLGDICGVEGTLMKTQTGELTIRLAKYTHLCKSLKPLPEKFHGLTDVEERYRKRYLDLIMNEDARRIAFMRPQIIRAIQHYLDGLGYVEVETSMLQPILGGANARPFITHHNALNKDFYLRIATELSLKKLLVGGMEQVYEIGRQFRNEGIDLTHNPEFTSLELYKAYGDLSDMMKLTEDMFRMLAHDVVGNYKLKWMGYDIDLEPEFRQASMCDLIKEKTGVDFREVKSDEEALALAKKFNVPVEKHFAYGHVVNAFFETFVESTLVQPTFVTGHPIEISPLTRKDEKDPRFVQRFELYIGTKEFCNAYTELNDPIDQRQRFMEQVKEKEEGNDEANEVDYSFLDAMDYGLPPTGGIGYGIDRLVMLLCGVDSIREVLLFPTMKDRGDAKQPTPAADAKKEEAK